MSGGSDSAAESPSRRAVSFAPALVSEWPANDAARQRPVSALASSAFKPTNSLLVIKNAHDSADSGLRPHSRMAKVPYVPRSARSNASSAVASPALATPTAGTFGASEAEHRETLQPLATEDATVAPVDDSDTTESRRGSTAGSVTVLLARPHSLGHKPNGKSAGKPSNDAASDRLSIDTRPMQRPRSAPPGFARPGSPSIAANASRTRTPSAHPKLVDAEGAKPVFVVPAHYPLDDWFAVCDRSGQEMQRRGSTKAWIHEPRSPRVTAGEDNEYLWQASPASRANHGQAFWRDTTRQINAQSLVRMSTSLSFSKAPECYGDLRCRRQSDVLQPAQVLKQHYLRMARLLERDPKVQKQAAYELAIRKEMFCTLLALHHGQPTPQQVEALLGLAQFWMRQSAPSAALKAALKAKGVLAAIIERAERQHQSGGGSSTVRRPSPVERLKAQQEHRDRQQRLCQLEAELDLWLADVRVSG